VSNFTSVADPDPNVFGPPGSRSDPLVRGMDYHHAKIVKKNPDSYYFVTLFDFLSLKNEVNVPSKSNEPKKFFNKFSFLLAS
jgi:hypothetical protein